MYPSKRLILPVRYIVVPAGSISVGRLPQCRLRATFKSLSIYEREGDVTLKPYPGLKALTGCVPTTFRRRVIDALGGLCRTVLSIPFMDVHLDL